MGKPWWFQSMGQAPNPNGHGDAGDAAWQPQPIGFRHAPNQHAHGQGHHAAGQNFGRNGYGAALFPIVYHRAKGLVLQQPVVKTR